jgi:hypothetical protein
MMKASKLTGALDVLLSANQNETVSGLDRLFDLQRQW